MSWVFVYGVRKIYLSSKPWLKASLQRNTALSLNDKEIKFNIQTLFE